jgi:hypothetical protein
MSLTGARGFARGAGTVPAGGPDGGAPQSVRMHGRTGPSSGYKRGVDPKRDPAERGGEAERKPTEGLGLLFLAAAAGLFALLALVGLVGYFALSR